MKYLTVNRGSEIVLFDEKNETANTVSYRNTNIDYLWVAPEDGTITINGNVEVVNAGDVILRLYGFGDYDGREYIVLKDDNLKSYYKRLADHEEKIIKKKIKYAGSPDLACDGCVAESPSF